MPSREIRERIVRSARRLVVKIGTHVLTDERGELDLRVVRSLCRQVSRLIEAGRQVAVVSSGAIGAGVGMLSLAGRPKRLPMLQAAAAVGQGKLMQIFEQALSRQGLHAAQVLVTRADFEDRRRYVNITRTLEALHRVRAVPILNENDTVAVDEIRFGDNDVIAALTANLVRADLMVLLTVVDGLYRGDELIDFVPRVQQDVLGVAQARKSTLGRGGMQSKLQSVLMATEAGVDVVIANGRRTDVLPKLILKGDRLGTVFAGQARKIASRRSWLAWAVRPAGRITVDAGAVRALSAGGKSLLPSGITGVTGRFSRGAVVEVAGPDGKCFARGQVKYAADEISRIAGRKTTEIPQILGAAVADEVIHRNDLTLISPDE